MDIWRMAARLREVGVALLLAFAVVHPAASQALTTGRTSEEMPEAAKQKILATYSRLPLRFEANGGQSHPQVDFLARGSGYTLYLTGTEAVLVPRRGHGDRADVLRMKLIGANPSPRAAGLEKLPGTAHYFIGNNPTMWRTNVPTYAKVEYRDVYPGVTLVYYGNQGALEYDFILAPGADPGAIRLAFEGATSIEVDTRGDLVLRTARGEVRQRRPVIYQEVSGVRHEVAGGYVLRERNQIAFRVAAYDAGRPLVIDPVLNYSTYLGGSGGGDEGNAIAVWTGPDGSLTAYVTGHTDSTDFPVPGGGASSAPGGGVNAFVAKFGPSGALLYTTYLGGSINDTGDDTGLGIAVDGSGNAYVTGRTTSFTFPTTAGAAYPSRSGSVADAFVTKLNASGVLVYSTYLGGTEFDEGRAIAVDGSGNAHVTGKTYSADFPTPNRLQAGLRGPSDAFVAKVNVGGSALMFATHLGGSGNETGHGIAVDGSGNAYVTGQTDSSDFPMANAFQPASGGGADAFVSAFNATGSALVYSTYLGGSNSDAGQAIAVDSVGIAYVTGQTASPNFPTMSAFQPAFGGGAADAFVTKLNASGTPAYSTYLGGSATDRGFGIGVDGSGNVYVTGGTFSSPFPTVDADLIQPTFGGVADVFVTKFNPAGSALVYSTYLGGGGEDVALGIAVDPSGAAHVIGYTTSQDFRTQNPSQAALMGARDAFVAKIHNPPPPAPPAPDPVPAPDPPAPAMVPFATFTVREFDLDRDDDGFELDALKARFTLGPGGSIDLAQDDVTIKVGSASVTIPRGSFEQYKNGRFKYKGIINGVRVKASIRSRHDGSYTFEVKGEEVRRGGRRDHRDDEPSFWWWKRHRGTSTPVTVELTIGNDSGTTTWNGKAAHRRTRDRGRDRERDD